MSDDDSLDQPNGTLRIGSYRLIERLGSGGMSSVLRAVHDETGHEVAVKVLPRYLAKNPILLQRFLREAKNAESLEHPSIVAIYDRGFDQGRYYLVLEYVPGGDLHDRVKREGPLPLDEAVRIVRSTCEGLRYAASRGLIHRDVKPANLLLTPEGQVKITDLGLALQTEEEDERVTRDGTTVGTVDFMAPEQARDSRATSIRSDMYSLGCSFYYILTGSPPFPGGDVVDKLRRHITEAPPDVRQLRPEVPESLARLLKRMMAKRPEDRYADYDQLIAALDGLKLDGSPPAGGPLYAIIDDEEQPTVPLYALIDDEGDEGGLAPASPAAGTPGPASTLDIDLAALAPLEEDESEPDDEPWPSAGAAAAARKSPKKPLLVFDEASEELPLAGAFHDDTEVAPIPRGTAVSIRPWILIGILVGAAVVVFGVGTVMFSSQGSSESETANETEPAPETIVPAPAAPAPRPIAKITPRQAPTPVPEKATRPVPAVVKSTPGDVPEPSYPPDVLGKFLPEWATSPIPERIDGPSVTVARVLAAEDSTHFSALWRALEKKGGTVELADCGPFFEDDFRMTGKDRLIRAKAGVRPILVVEPPIVEFVKAQQAVIVLEGARLVLDGLDLVVNVASLPANQSALFLCRGSELTLHNCTVTVVNPAKRPFHLVQTDGPASGASRPSWVRLEKSLVRGESVTAFGMLGGGAEVAVSRSVVTSGSAPIVAITGNSVADTGKARRFHFVRSLLVSSGPALRVGGVAQGGVLVRALGSTFARLPGEGTAGLMALKETSGQAPHEGVDWLGEDNVYTGWAHWMVAGPGPSPVLTDLADARTVWPGTDLHSRQTLEGGPPPASPVWFHPIELERLAPDRLATLVRVAAPRPFLREKTLGLFDRLPAPPAPERRTVAATPAGGPNEDGFLIRKRMETMSRGLPEGVQGSPGESPTPPGSRPGLSVTPRDGEIVFDAQAPAWQGDLGKFLASQFKPGVKAMKVLACGFGNYAMTPVTIPEGLDLEVTVDMGSLAGNNALSWTPRAENGGEALIDARQASIRLTGVRISWRDNVPGLKHLVRVEEGSLALVQCWLRAPAAGAVEGSSLVALRTTGGAGTTEQGALAQLPAFRMIDCLLVSAGDAVAATLTHGVVALENCAVASGRRAFVMRTRDVSPDRFQADLWVDRCTVVAERGSVDFGPWAGSGSAPVRPWLISSRSTAWLGAHTRGVDSVLLRVDPEAMCQGTLAWQGQGDAADVVRFTAPDNAPAASIKRPDVKHQWVNLWGASHMSSLTGPSASTARPSTRLLASNLRPGQVGPNDLALDPSYHPGRAVLDVGADLRPITLKGMGTKPAGRSASPGQGPFGTSSVGPASSR